MTLRIILEVLIRLLSPILPHTCDEVYEALNPGTTETVQGLNALNTTFENQYPWDVVIETRKNVQKILEDAKINGIENSLDAGICIPAASNLQPFMADLADIFGVSRVEVHDLNSIDIQDLRDELRCERSWKRDITVKEWPNGSILSERDYHAINKTN